MPNDNKKIKGPSTPIQKPTTIREDRSNSGKHGKGITLPPERPSKPKKP